jgi:hypothetical protein
LHERLANAPRKEGRPSIARGPTPSAARAAARVSLRLPHRSNADRLIRPFAATSLQTPAIVQSTPHGASDHRVFRPLPRLQLSQPLPRMVLVRAHLRGFSAPRPDRSHVDLELAVRGGLEFAGPSSTPLPGSEIRRLAILRGPQLAQGTGEVGPTDSVFRTVPQVARGAANAEQSRRTASFAYTYSCEAPMAIIWRCPLAPCGCASSPSYAAPSSPLRPPASPPSAYPTVSRLAPYAPWARRAALSLVPFPAADARAIAPARACCGAHVSRRLCPSVPTLHSLCAPSCRTHFGTSRPRAVIPFRRHSPDAHFHILTSPSTYGMRPPH